MNEIQYIRKLYEEALSYRSAHDKKWYDNYAALYGYQWTEWRNLEKYFLNYLALPGRDERRVRITINKINTIMKARASFIIGDDPKIFIYSNSDETDDKEAAYMAQRVARADWEQNNLYAKILEAWEWTKSCGMSFIRTYYDHSAGKYIGKHNGKPVFEGQVKAQVLPVFSVFWDPVASNWNDIRYCIVGSIYQLETLMGMGLNVDYEVLAKDTSALAPVSIQNLILQLSDPNYKFREDKDYKNRKRAILVLEYFEKPSVEYPEGRYLMIIGNQVVKNLPLEFGIIPLTLFADSTIAGTINCETPVTEMRPIQEALNIFVSLDIERSKLPDIYAFGMGSGFPKNFGDRAVVLTEYRPGMGEPKYIQGGMSRPDYLEKIIRYEEWMENIAGVSSISSRARPPYAMSGRMGYIVTDASRALLSDIRQRFKRSVAELIKTRLLFMKKYYVEERIMSFINEYDRREVVRFTGSEIGENWAVSIEIAEGKQDPESRAFKLLQLNQNPMVMKELMRDPVAYKKFLIGVDPEIGYEFFRSENDTDVARDENFEMFKGGICKVMPWHDDQIHLIEHKRQLDSDTLRKWSPKAVDTLILHYYLHEQQSQIKLQKEMMKQALLLQSAQQLQAQQGMNNIPKQPGMDMLASGPATPIQAIDQTLEGQTQQAFPGAEMLPVSKAEETKP